MKTADEVVVRGTAGTSSTARTRRTGLDVARARTLGKVPVAAAKKQLYSLSGGGAPGVFCRPPLASAASASSISP